MNKTLKRILYWAPRSAAILFVLFLSLFAFDVFDSTSSIWRILLGLLIHLIPSILLSVAIAIAWKREWLGAALFIGWAIWYVLAIRNSFEWTAFLLISGLPTLIGLLFLAGWIWRRQIRGA